MTAFDRRQVIEDAARAIWEPGVIYGGKRFGWDDLKEDSRRRLREDAVAALPVIVAAVLKPIRELHRECDRMSRTPGCCWHDGHGWPCPTARLCDEIESSAKGGE